MFRRPHGCFGIPMWSAKPRLKTTVLLHENLCMSGHTFIAPKHVKIIVGFLLNYNLCLLLNSQLHLVVSSIQYW